MKCNLTDEDCSNSAECEAVCPKKIFILAIAEMRRNCVKATLAGEGV